MTELEYATKHGGLTPRQLLRKMSRRGFGGAFLSGVTGAAASVLIGGAAQQTSRPDFTIAIIPNPQYLAESCKSGEYYKAMMSWIVENKNSH